MGNDSSAVARSSPWSWDTEADVVWCLPAMLELHGRALPEGRTGEPGAALRMPARELLELVPASHRDRARELLKDADEGAGGGELTYPLAGTGEIRWLELKAVAGHVIDGRAIHVLGQVRDVTAERLLEVRHERAQRELDLHEQAIERIAAGDPLVPTLELLCRHLERTQPGCFCELMLLDRAAGVLRSCVAPSLSADYRAARDGLVVRDGGGACATAVATGLTVVLSDVRADPRAAAALELYEAYGLRAVWVYPMRGVTGAVIGTIAVYRSEPFEPSEAEVRAVARSGRLAALAIERDGIARAIERDANVYPSTGLLSRPHFQELLARRLAEPLRRTAVLFVEVEGLRYLGEDRGHVAGATLLAELARRLRSAAGDDAIIGRFSGEEFTIADDGPSDAHVAELATRLQVAFSSPVALGDAELFLVCTVGVAVTAPGADAQELILRAATAMHAARADGGGSHRTFSRALARGGVDLIGRESELRRAIDFGELILHYQPILDVRRHRWDRVEALVRWRHPTRGLLAPAEFIQLAEKSGLIVPLGRRVLELATQQGARWVAAMPGLRIAVNVSVLELTRKGFVEDLLEAIGEAGLPASAVYLETSESGLIQRLATVAPVLERLRDHGVSATVDHFGAGYSALARLGELPVAALKIDRSFIAGLRVGAGSGAAGADTVVGSIVAIARAHGLSVAAHGVEDAAALAAVDRLGCDYAQGFHVAVPAAPEDVEPLLFEALAAQPAVTGAPSLADQRPWT